MIEIFNALIAISRVAIDSVMEGATDQELEQLQAAADQLLKRVTAERQWRQEDHS